MLKWYVFPITKADITPRIDYFIENKIPTTPIYINNVLLGVKNNPLNKISITVNVFSNLVAYGYNTESARNVINSSYYRFGSYQNYEDRVATVFGVDGDIIYNTQDDLLKNYETPLVSSIIEEGVYKYRSGRGLISDNVINRLSQPYKISCNGFIKLNSGEQLEFNNIFSTNRNQNTLYDTSTTDGTFKIGLLTDVNGVQRNTIVFELSDNYASSLVYYNNTYSSASSVIDYIYFYETEIPKNIKDVIDFAFDRQYTETFEIKNDNDEILTSINEAPPIKETILSKVGSLSTLIFTGVNNIQYQLNWEQNTPEGKTLAGLSNTPNGSIIIPIGKKTFDTPIKSSSFYEVYKTYRPFDEDFAIWLGKNTAEQNRVDKRDYVINVGEFFGKLREQSSLTSPSIIFQYDGVPDFNYAHIPLFNRYYYITEITSIRNGLWELSLDVDVLMTYMDGIKTCKGFIDRNEFVYNLDIIDTKRVIEQGQDIEVIPIQNNLFDTQGSFILQGFALKNNERS